MNTVNQIQDSLSMAATPVPIAVSTATVLGFHLNDWVLIGTALLVACQLVVIIPKVFKTLRDLKGRERE